MKNWLKQAGFIKSEDSLIPEKKIESTNVQNVQNNVFPLQHQPVNIGVKDSKYDSLLREVMEKNNLDGPDFLEFYKALESFENQPIPEVQKYLFAYTTLATLGVTKDKLISSAEHYLGALATEKNTFEGHLAEVNRVEVEEAKFDIVKLNEENAKLQAQIQENLNKIAQLNQDSTESNARIIMARTSFESTYNSLVSKIQIIINNIKLNIQ